MLVAQIVEQGPAATVEERLLVVAQAVQEIKHRIATWRMLGGARIVTSRQIDAVADNLLKNAAIQRAAVDAALSARRAASDQEQNADKSRDADHAESFIRIAAPAPDQAWRRAPLDISLKPG